MKRRTRIRKAVSRVALLVTVSWTGLGAHEGQWIAPGPVVEVNTPNRERGAALSPDGLELFVDGDGRPGGRGGRDIWVFRREDSEGSFDDPPINLGPVVNTSNDDFVGGLSFDGLELYFSSGGDLYFARRESTDASSPWQARVPITELNDPSAFDGACSVTEDGLEIVFVSRRSGSLGGSNDLWLSRRPDRDSLWDPPRNLAEINTFATETFGSISGDGRDLFWSVYSNGTSQLWCATREHRDDGFGNVRPLAPELNVGFNAFPRVSADFPDAGATLYWVRCFSEQNCDIYSATWIPAPPADRRFLRGDCDGDGNACSGVSDALLLFNWLFLGGTQPPCPAACDVADDRGELDLTDGIFSLSFCFLGGPPPAAPFPACGTSDLEADETLGCAETPEHCR